ncbi:interferon-induced transmembrane protein 3-like [Trichosurus vulpecula]|uniref:interferon-induced transmembrane protein 3-like n=1 Tax=Trichosurus vulpecula TaxID=9337 RepID=UPI00186AF5EB|nr:interferon-induced transmembrane protein 3-like [Trichosurus vulpecula]
MPDHTVIAMQDGGPEKRLTSAPPRDYLLFSLFNILVLGNPCCLSFVALVYSVKSRDRKLVGDMNQALSYGNTSKQLNIGSIILNVLLLIISIVLFFLYMVPWIQAKSNH